MTIKSMTAFARVDGGNERVKWHWEIRSVNGRGLDLRFRLPSGSEELEQRIRALCSKTLARGNCSIHLTVKKYSQGAEIQLNEAALKEVIRAAELAQKLCQAEPPRIDGLLAQKGVLELKDADESEEELSARIELMFQDFNTALLELVKMREEEGARLAQAIGEQIERIDHLVQQAEKAECRRPERIAEKMKAQVQRLLETERELDEARLHQEVAILATKADIEEELERLRGHIIAGRDLLKSGKPSGRKFDFLSQEFLREANTICSKAPDSAITQIGLELKVIIDQMREQVQNIE